MIIEHRDTSLNYTQGIKHEKIRIILDWLLEFRFSSLDILAERIDLNRRYMSRFLKYLVENNMIASFKNLRMGDKRYFILTQNGVSYLEAHNRDVSIAVTRTRHLGSMSRIFHHLMLQKAVLKMIKSRNFKQITWNRNIRFDDKKFANPDALIQTVQGDWFAIEYEWKKNRENRIFLSYLKQIQAFQNNWYSGVYYVFAEESDLKHYQKLFDYEEWPKVKRDNKSGKVHKLGLTLKPSDLEIHRSRYKFRYEPN